MVISREVHKRIAPFMKSRGVSNSGQNRYYYVANDLAFCIAFEMPSGLMYVTAYVMPLYIPCEFRYLTYGNRLNHVRDIKLPLLDKDSGEEAIDAWCKLFCCSMDQKIIPFFQTVDTPDKLLRFSEKNRFSSDSYIACNKLDILRLRMFTFLFVDDTVDTALVLTCYQEVLNSASHLSDKVIQMRFEEIYMIESLMQEKNTAKNYFTGVEIDTRKIL